MKLQIDGVAGHDELSADVPQHVQTLSDVVESMIESVDRRNEAPKELVRRETNGTAQPDEAVPQIGDRSTAGSERSIPTGR